MEGEHQKPMFQEITADDPDQQPTEIESYCINCGQNGITKILLTKIPHYKEVILMSFSCEHCGLQNNEIQSGAKIQEKGIRFTVSIENARDMSRQVVKSDYATISVPELELEIPPTEKKGEITTVEGVLRRVITGLLQDQAVRRALHPEDADKIDEYIKKIETYINLEHPFKIILTDPSGDSFIENLYAPKPDPSREMEFFERSPEEDHLVGIYSQEDLRDTTNDNVNGREAAIPEEDERDKDVENFQDEILSFRTNCPECNSPAETNMKVTCIPHFKEVVIMATVCDYCGHKTNEVKSGGGMEDKGKKITLKVTDSSDLSRDVLKSETCSLMIPELELEMGCHALSGRFTTLEGLLRNVYEQIVQNPIHGGRMLVGDSADDGSRLRFEEFSNELNSMIEAKRLPFTIVLDDPAGNSYLQNVYAPEDDPEMEVKHYERSWEQNEMLGINDMKVEGYEVEETTKEDVK